MKRRLIAGLVVAFAAAGAWAAVHARTVTRVAIVAKPRRYVGPCPAQLQFIATVFVSHHPTEVLYRWERSDGATAAAQKAVINSAGQGFTDDWSLGGGREHRVVWERLHVLAPTNVSSPIARVPVTCR